MQGEPHVHHSKLLFGLKPIGEIAPGLFFVFLFLDDDRVNVVRTRGDYRQNESSENRKSDIFKQSHETQLSHGRPSAQAVSVLQALSLMRSTVNDAHKQKETRKWNGNSN